MSNQLQLSFMFDVEQDACPAKAGEGDFASAESAGADSFLTLVARHLLQQYGSNLSGVTVVFPGKRASLFLDQALARESQTPVWTPRYTTIAELFASLSPYRQANPVESVCRLHRVYARHVPNPLTLDQFYTWGEVLLSDFDDIDKHLVQAERLFTNIADLKALDTNEYITPEQEAALNAFFASFSLEKNSELKERFLQLWRFMPAIYRDFNADMRRAGIMYEGALQREVAERLCRADASEQPFSGTYLFVGFNVLNDVEERLFSHLKREGLARFYWDYDRYYTAPSALQHEAGHFMRRNLERYGNELPSDCFDNLCPDGRCTKQVTMIAASSESAQASYVDAWLGRHLTRPENRTAVVLCNEALLQPVLHAVPRTVPLNVTMGLPLQHTPVYSLVNALMALHTDGWDAARKRFRRSQLRAVQTHPLAQLLDEQQWQRPVADASDFTGYLRTLLASVASAMSRRAAAGTSAEQTSSETKPSALGTDDPLHAEALFCCYETLGVLQRLTEGEQPLLDVSRSTLRRLIRSVLHSATVPFHGEPAVGMQVLGILETRALDFDHLLMLSVGEGYLPRSSADVTLIPYALKEAFGLTTIRHQMAVYAYYFYRLIQRAKVLTFVYNESNAGTRANEISRFLRQLMADAAIPVSHQRLTAASNVFRTAPVAVAKTAEVVSTLRQRFDHTGLPADEHSRVLSPTAINTYSTCPLSFYYKYVRDMRVNPEPADGLDAAVFGNVFHKAAQLTYEELRQRGSDITHSDLDRLLTDAQGRLEEHVDRAFLLEYFRPRNEHPAYEGLLILARRAVSAYLRRLVEYDRERTPFTVVKLEKWCQMHLNLEAELGMDIVTGGIIDRLDQHIDADTGQTVVRVLDYKTGSRNGAVSQLAKLFADTGQLEHYYFQTILYAVIEATDRHEPCLVQPCLFHVHRAGAADFSPNLRLEGKALTDVSALRDDFISSLRTLVLEIFNPDVPFQPTTNLVRCRTCPYRMLCGR